MSILLADIDATCAALGYSDGQRYQIEPDAVQGLKHLIWILRRDLENHEYRRHLGRSKVLQTDLVYMLSDYIAEEELADVLIRLSVILTNPTLLLYRDGPPKDNHGRKVFLELIDILQGYKTAFTSDKIWTALYGKLQKALEIDWALRSEEQNLLIERILVLIRNVLQVPANPELECRADNDASIHDQVIWALHQSGILDLVLFVISSPDEHQFHLHGLEILCLLYREQTADSLADASLQRSNSEKQRDEHELLAARRREKQRFLSRPPPGRHSRFGGTYVIRNLKSVSERDIICHQPLERVVSIDFDREKEQQKRSHRIIKEEAQVSRRSAFSVRLCLREYCIEVLRSAYNTLVRQVRRVLERNSGSSNHDDSYLLWVIRFFMEFNRLSSMQLQLVSESLSVQCFHWVLTRMQHDMDMIVSDKKQARLWAKRLHVAVQTFRELLQSLLALQRLQNDDKAQALFDMLLNNVCYVLEYRESILHLLMNYNESHSTKAYLRDVAETANIFIKMMEKFCKSSVLVQDKKRSKKSRSQQKNIKNLEKDQYKTEEELENKWAEMASEISRVLTTDSNLPEEEQPLPFDAASEKSIEDQKEDCMVRIHKMLREEKFEYAVSLVRSAREVWPENDIFGSITVAPEDEMLILREIFMSNIKTDDNHDDHNVHDELEDEIQENEEMEDDGMVEKTFKFDDFVKRLLNPKIVRACTVVLTDWQQIPTKSLKAAVTVLHRIAYGCSCPAMLYQAKLFRIFQQVFNTARDSHNEELRRLGIFIVRKFVETAPTNPKIYAELLFYKTVRDANELETGYCDDYDAGTKGKWTEVQETELRLLFEENQRNPETDKDVIDWLLENIIDKTRTRRGILKKLREMGLQFKAPTKKSSHNAQAGKNLWRHEDDTELQSLYDEYRLEADCLQRILDAFEDRRNKQQIIKRMLQLHIIADKSEILPAKPRRRKANKKNRNSSDDDDGNDFEENVMEEPQFGAMDTNSSIRPQNVSKKNKPKQPKARKIVRTPLDVGTIRALVNEIDEKKYKDALDWLKECLDEAAEDTEEPSEEDDGVPLLPLLEIQKEAMEDGNFQKVLVALGIQPPITGIENYWRIPTYLNSADIKLRAQIVAGEEIKIDEIDENESLSELSEVANEKDEDSEEDYFESKANTEHKKNDGLDDYMNEQREKMKNLLFTKSDEEEEIRQPLKANKKKAKKMQKILTKDDEMDVDEITRKLYKKKRNPDWTSEEEVDFNDLNKNKKSTKKEAKKSEKAKLLNGDLFDKLKKTRAKKINIADVLADDKNKIEENDVFNTNSKDYNKRLLELVDSDIDETVDKIEKNTNIIKNRIRRANVIDSDSDEEASHTSDNKVRATHVNNVVKNLQNNDNDVDNDGGADNDDIIDKTSNQAMTDTGNKNKNITAIGSDGDGDATSIITTKSNKRRRHHDSSESDLEDANNKSESTDTRGVSTDKNNIAVISDNDNDEDEDDDDNFLVRRKPTRAEKALIANGEEPAKRRRIAIINDDDEDDD